MEAGGVGLFALQHFQQFFGGLIGHLVERDFYGGESGCFFAEQIDAVESHQCNVLRNAEAALFQRIHAEHGQLVGQAEDGIDLVDGGAVEDEVGDHLFIRADDADEEWSVDPQSVRVFAAADRIDGAA